MSSHHLVMGVCVLPDWLNQSWYAKRFHTRIKPSQSQERLTQSAKPSSGCPSNLNKTEPYSRPLVWEYLHQNDLSQDAKAIIKAKMLFTKMHMKIAFSIIRRPPNQEKNESNQFFYKYSL